MTASIRLGFLGCPSDEPPPDCGTFELEAEMARLDDAAQDAQIAAEDFEIDGKLDEAEMALALRDALNERYAELRRQVDGEDAW